MIRSIATWLLFLLAFTLVMPMGAMAGTFHHGHGDACLSVTVLESASAIHIADAATDDHERQSLSCSSAGFCAALVPQASGLSAASAPPQLMLVHSWPWSPSDRLDRPPRA
ncbi:hypothetical protein Q427_00680 [Halomonas sp. BC04]|nr:hypothetical protein Q427_00680 [Halomonas sp. BC04]